MSSHELDFDEPQQSSGNAYILDSEDTDSAEEIIEQEDNTEIDLNVKKNESRKKCRRKIETPHQSRQDRKKYANFNIKYISVRKLYHLSF